MYSNQLRFLFAGILLTFTCSSLAQEAAGDPQTKPGKAGEPSASDQKPASEKPTTQPSDQPTKSTESKSQPEQPAAEKAETVKPAEEKNEEKNPQAQADAKADEPKPEDTKPADAKAADEKPADGADKKDGAKGDELKKDGSKKDNSKKDGTEKEIPKKQEPVEPAKLPNIGSTDTSMIPGQQWRVHDRRRPQPRVVTPGELSTYDKPGTAPSDAIVLFDGTDLSQWTHIGPDGPDDLREAQWKVVDGAIEVVPRTGYMQSLDSFGSCQLHIEWRTPEQVRGNSQGRGNSGIKLMGVYEVQVLDSFNNRTYADGQAGAMYGQYPPMVNASRQPGQWQVYDLIFEAPKFDLDGELLESAYLTLIHNGILLHHRRPFHGPTGRDLKPYNFESPAAPIALQDHGNPLRYRNIWVRPLDL